MVQKLYNGIQQVDITNFGNFNKDFQEFLELAHG
jgi:hypothetical protein